MGTIVGCMVNVLVHQISRTLKGRTSTELTIFCTVLIIIIDLSIIMGILVLMRLQLESIQPDSGSSFRILLTPNLNTIYFWHFHPEIELVYVEAEKGTRHIGDHISAYHGSDLALIGSYIPHLNFDYGVSSTVNTVVVQMQEHFFDEKLAGIPEFNSLQLLFEKARSGLAFGEKAKSLVSDRLKKIHQVDRFQQFMELLEILHLLANSNDWTDLRSSPISNASLIKQHQRIHSVYQHIEESFTEPIDTAAIAKKVNMSLPAFCRYFKKTTRLTYTDFVNQYRINYSKKLLLQGMNISEACFASGFENLSYYNRLFNKIVGMNPSSFRKQQLSSISTEANRD